MSVDMIVNKDDDKSKEKPKLRKVNSRSSNDSDKTEWINHNNDVLSATKTPPSPPKSISPANDDELFNKTTIEAVNKNFLIHLNNEIKKFDIVGVYNQLLLNEQINLLDFTRFCSCIYYKLSILELNEQANEINKHLQCVVQSPSGVVSNDYLMFILTIILKIDYTKKKMPQTPLSFSFRNMYA